MSMRTTIIRSLTAVTLSITASMAAATTPPVTFDTATADTAQTESLYGLQAVNVGSAVVSGGQLRLYGSNGLQGALMFAAFAGDLRIEYDTTQFGPPGYVNVGFRTPSYDFFFHPGYWGQWFGGPGGNFGFTPSASEYIHLTINVTAATKTFQFTVLSGSQQAQFSLVDSAYQPGVSRLGFSAGMSTGGGYYAVFDNLAITPVPEPSTAALWAVALAGGLMAVRRRTNRVGRRPQRMVRQP